MNRRGAVLVAVAGLIVVLSLMAPAVAAQQNATSTPNATATPTSTPAPTETPQTVDASDVPGASAGPYSITELRQNGRSEGVDTVPSVRALGDPPQGFVAARYRNPNLFDAIFGSDGGWQEVQSHSVIQQNKLQVYGSAFGETSGEYTLVLVYWQRSTADVNGTQVAYASNQTVERQTINLDEEDLYTFENVSLQQHLDQTWRVTMWLERGGEPVGGRDVQWTFRHRSNPESSAVDINSKADAWGFALRNAVLPGVASLIVGLIGSRWTLRRTGRGPGYGLGSWLFIVTIMFALVGAIAYYQIAVILQNLPWVMGGSIGVIAFAAGLTFHQPVQVIGFMRRELADVIRIPGGSAVSRISDGGTATMDAAMDFVQGEDGGAELFDEFTEAMFIDLPQVPAVRTDDGYRVPVTGVMPFIARIFADAALLDLSNIATRQKVRVGKLSDIIITDPKKRDALEHKPARLVRVLPWDTISDDADTVSEMWAAVLTAAIVIAPATVGYIALDAAMNIGSVGAVLGFIGTLVMAYSAEDGWIDFDVAPPHYVRAEDNLTVLQRAYQESKEEQSAKQEAWTERATTALEARKDRMEESRTVTDRIFGGMGADHAIDGAADEEDGFEFEGDDDDEDDDDDEAAPAVTTDA